MSTYSFPYLSKLAVGYLKAGHSVDVFTCSETVSQPMSISGGQLTVHVGRRRVSARERGLDFFRTERADLVALMEAAAPDVVHAHWLYEFGSAALTYQDDSLVTAHDSPSALVRNYKHPYWWFRAGLGLRTIHRLRNLSVVSPSLSTEIPESWIRRKNVALIPNGIDIPSGFTGRPKVGNPPVTFACVANGFDARKNTSSAIVAFSLARRKLPDSKLLLFGTGHGAGEAAYEWASSRDLCDGVCFIGATTHEELLAYLGRDVDVLVHTSVWEACSMAILEAQAHGIPVVGGEKSGGVAYTLAYGSIGLLVDVKDPYSVARAMVDLVSDEKFYSEISRRAVDTMRTRFGFEGVVDRYLSRLEGILDARH
ncbi:glycosyltransferase family 4 protein [Rhodococcus sp. NPDC058639]|uniref:glycosyltransferase family 4 protein n=1 Tax=Rhodococcus sp. NPDC058639 TaxID=3346570 RepID=UPI0036557243